MRQPMNREFEQFDAAIGTILRADPKAVKAAVDAEIKGHTAERKARGERKRGRKPKSTSASDRASNDQT
jgi:hypothetical protein